MLNQKNKIIQFHFTNASYLDVVVDSALYPNIIYQMDQSDKNCFMIIDVNNVTRLIMKEHITWMNIKYSES